MNTRLLACLSLLLASFPIALSAAPAGDLFIVPGKRIGLTPLGPQGSRTLDHMAKPHRSDGAMSQGYFVWVSQPPTGGPYTLFIHTTSNGALDVKPLNGLTIDCIRVTSPHFVTRAARGRGDGLRVGSTLAQIRRRFPRVRPVDGDRTLYDDARSGIAFEFARPAAPSSRAIAVMIHPPGDSQFADARQVRDLLQSPPDIP